jgi:membrane-associated phospholipid phosphatase
MAQLAGQHSMRHIRTAVVSFDGVMVVLASVALLALAFFAHAIPYFGFDLSATRAVQGIHVGAFDALMQIVGAPGYPPQVYVVIVLMLAILWAFKLKWEALAQTFAVLGIGIVGLAIKMLVDRPRPTAELVNVMTTLDNGKQSFPAGHVESYVAIIGFLWYLSYTLLPKHTAGRLVELLVYGTMIAFIGLSRVYVGEHWLSDVIGGYLFGGIWLWLTIQLYQWGKPRFFQKERGKADGKQ